ncbi:MAG: carboxypeptidase-like regulatory domain-containing protein [Acidobacteriia bacterium]|nr:carboxypeptidase-like regulatory domain-containing protein [Terriglobia bacterium]
MGADSHFVKDFVVAVLASVVAGAIIAIFFGGLRWTLKKHLTVTVPIIVLSAFAAWAVTNWTSEPVIGVAGTVVDESTNEPIAQAKVNLPDENVRDTSEDNGNFRLKLTHKLNGKRVHINVAKDGYRPFDATVEVPSEDFIVKLHHL